MTTATVPLAVAVGTAASPPDALGLSVCELEELLIAIGDREDHAGAEERRRLRRGRLALERELARLLAGR